ncbi:MAG: nucleotidyltransferase domain-containing protein [Planctomycetota bacterium]
MDQDVLDEVVRRIVEVASPEKIILFGSRARGAARGDSDLDLLVVKPSDEPRFRRAVPLYLALRDIDVALDVLVYTPEEIEEWRDVRQAFVTTALREGKVLYERAA